MRRLGLVWVVLAATGGLLATGRLDAAPTPEPEIGTARVAYRDAAHQPGHRDGVVETASYGAGVDLVASYPIVDDRLVADATVDPGDQRLWDLVVDTIPDRWRLRIRQFSVIDEQPAHTVAMVHQSGHDPDRWLLSIDRADADNEALVRDTLVHELAHLITLDPAEFTFTHRLDEHGDGGCDGVRIEIGCAHDGSMLARWATSFWATPDAPGTYDPATFVAPYAATGPHEDLAETYLYWQRGDLPVGAGLVLEAKFAFVERELGPGAVS